MGRNVLKKLCLFFCITILGYILFVAIKHHSILSSWFSTFGGWIIDDILIFLVFIVGALTLVIISTIYDHFKRKNKKNNKASKPNNEKNNNPKT